MDEFGRLINNLEEKLSSASEVVDASRSDSFGREGEAVAGAVFFWLRSYGSSDSPAERAAILSKAVSEIIERFADSSLGLRQFMAIFLKIRDLAGEVSADRQTVAVIRGFFNGLIGGTAEGWIRYETAVYRKKYQETRRYIFREKRRYSTIFNGMGEAACLIDQDLCLLETNPAFGRCFGPRRSGFKGMAFSELVGRNPSVSKQLCRLMAEGGSFTNLETSWPMAGRRDRAVLISGAYLGEVEGAGQATGLLIIQDITELKGIEEELDEYRCWLEDFVDERTEELLIINGKLKQQIDRRREVEKELVRMTAELRKSNAELEHFAYVASHDLKEPLMLVSAFSDRLLSRCGAALDERGREYIKRIIKAAGQLQKLVEALLQLSRITTSTRRFVPIDLSALVEDVVADLEEAVKRTCARVIVEPLDELYGDEVQIRQLFQNLISNSLKYHRPDIVPEVRISSSILAGDNCEITVEDNGIGFHEKDLERIFQPLVRLHARDRYGGSGLGLTTCKKIVVRHGGEITASSCPGAGSVFVVRLPIQPVVDQS